MEQNYKVVNGTCYNENTPNEVIKVLEDARRNNTRIRIFLGDLSTGEDWLDEYDTIGYVGRSSGSCKIPILLSQERSLGGGILTHRIVRITIDKKEVYRNSRYVVPNLEVCDNVGELKEEYPFNVYSKDKKTVIANFKTKDKAERYVAFLRGERNCK